MAHPTAFLLATPGGFPGYNSPHLPILLLCRTALSRGKHIKLLSPGKEDEKTHVTTKMAPLT